MNLRGIRPGSIIEERNGNIYRIVDVLIGDGVLKLNQGESVRVERAFRHPGKELISLSICRTDRLDNVIHDTYLYSGRAIDHARSRNESTFDIVRIIKDTRQLKKLTNKNLEKFLKHA